MASLEEKKDLSPEKVNQEIEKEVLKIRKGELKISEISNSYPNAQEIIDSAIEFRPLFFAELRPEQRTEKNALIFLKHVLTTTQNKNEQEVSYFETLDNAPALKIHYISVADESVEYFDDDLQLPTQLKSKLSLALAIDNVSSLFNKLNLKLSDFSLIKLYYSIRTEITNIVKNEVLSYIKNNKLGYFKFEYACQEIEKSVLNNLIVVFKDFGLKVIKFNFEKISIPDQITNIIQNEYMNARSLSIRSQAEVQWATSSLEILKLKSEIIEKYKLPADTLSEMEKDKALERYIKKAKQLIDDKITFEKEEANNTNCEDVLIATKPISPTKPAEVIDTNKEKIKKLAIADAISLAAIVAGFVLDQSIIYIIGIIALVIITGFIVYVMINKKKNNQALIEYKEQMQIYEEAMKVYSKEKHDYDSALDKYQKDKAKYYLKENGIYEKKTNIL